MRYIVNTVALLSIFLFSGAALSNADMTALASNLQRIENVKANFEQRVIGQDAQLLEVSTGVLYLQKPGKFKWEYSNQEQLIVSDGEKIYFQMNDLEQVIERDFQQAIETVPSLVLVSDLSKLDALFDVDAKKSFGNVDIFYLTPKAAQSTYSSIVLSFMESNLLSLKIIDGIGQSTEVVMQSKLDYSELSSNEFNYSAPQGYDLIQG